MGINIGAVRIYGRQLFYALRHLADLRVVHADIKLDNILCSGDLKQVLPLHPDLTYLEDILLILSFLSGEAMRLRLSVPRDGLGQRPHPVPGQQVLPRARDHPRHAMYAAMLIP